MALTRTLAQIVDAIQRTADVVSFTDRHPVSYIKDLACRGIAALHRITATTDTEFRPVSFTSYTTNGVQTSFPLPTDCRSILAVEYTVDGHKDWLDPYEWAERPMLSDSEVQQQGDGRARGYKRLGNNLEFLPRPAAGQTILVWFATTASQPTGDGDTVDVYDRLDDYIIWFAAAEIALERENFQRYDRLIARMANLEGEIRILARSRDLSASSHMVERRRMREVFGRRRFWR